MTSPSTSLPTDRIESHVRALYERAPLSSPLWDADLGFSDPLVHVAGRDAVLTMFERLGTLVPETRVVRCEPLVGAGGTIERWALEVDWRRSLRGGGLRLQSMLDVDVRDGRIIGLTEHWRAPIRADGAPTGAARTWLRERFGAWSARPIRR